MPELSKTNKVEGHESSEQNRRHGGVARKIGTMSNTLSNIENETNRAENETQRVTITEKDRDAFFNPDLAFGKAAREERNYAVNRLLKDMSPRKRRLLAEKCFYGMNFSKRNQNLSFKYDSFVQDFGEKTIMRDAALAGCQQKHYERLKAEQEEQRSARGGYGVVEYDLNNPRSLELLVIAGIRGGNWLDAGHDEVHVRKSTNFDDYNNAIDIVGSVKKDGFKRLAFGIDVTCNPDPKELEKKLNRTSRGGLSEGQEGKSGIGYVKYYYDGKNLKDRFRVPRFVAATEYFDNPSFSPKDMNRPKYRETKFKVLSEFAHEARAFYTSEMAKDAENGDRAAQMMKDFVEYFDQALDDCAQEFLPSSEEVAEKRRIIAAAKNSIFKPTEIGENDKLREQYDSGNKAAVIAGLEKQFMENDDVYKNLMAEIEKIKGR